MLYGTGFPGPFVQGGVPSQVPQTFLAPTQTFPGQTQTTPFVQAAPWTTVQPYGQPYIQPYVQGFVPLDAEPEWDWDDEGEYLGIVGINPFRRRRRRFFRRGFGKPFGKGGFGKFGGKGFGKPFGKFGGKPYGKPFGKGGFGKY